MYKHPHALSRVIMCMFGSNYPKSKPQEQWIVMSQKFNDLNQILEKDENQEDVIMALFVTDEGGSSADFAATDFNPSDFSTT
jgi:hypothetical protein